jgi:hypothetical protein
MLRAQRLSNLVAAISSSVATLLVTLIFGWLTLGRDAVGREEAIDLIDSRGPYIADRQALHAAIERNSTQIDELTRTSRELERQMQRVEAKLDLLLGEPALNQERRSEPQRARRSAEEERQ